MRLRGWESVAPPETVERKRRWMGDCSTAPAGRWMKAPSSMKAVLSAVSASRRKSAWRASSRATRSRVCASAARRLPMNDPPELQAGEENSRRGWPDRESVGEGKRGDLGGRPILKKKKKKNEMKENPQITKEVTRRSLLSNSQATQLPFIASTCAASLSRHMYLLYYLSSD